MCAACLGGWLAAFSAACRVNMKAIEVTIHNLISSGMDPKTENNAYLGFIYTSFQERATKVRTVHTHGLWCVTHCRRLWQQLEDGLGCRGFFGGWACEPQAGRAAPVLLCRPPGLLAWGRDAAAASSVGPAAHLALLAARCLPARCADVWVSGLCCLLLLQISHGNTARHALEHGDDVLAKICGTIASDEGRHEQAYQRVSAMGAQPQPQHSAARGAPPGVSWGAASSASQCCARALHAGCTGQHTACTDKLCACSGVVVLLV